MNDDVPYRNLRDVVTSSSRRVENLRTGSVPWSTHARRNLDSHILIHQFPSPSPHPPLHPPVNRTRPTEVCICTSCRIPASFMCSGIPLHEGAIRIPFKQVVARMKLISRLLRMRRIPEAVFHGPPISSHSSAKCAR